MSRSRRRGLSLIEIIVVITIVSMLMSAVAVYAVGVHRRSQRTTARMDVKNAATALELYRATRGRYPDPGEGFEPLVKAKTLKELPRDPWGTPLEWRAVDGEPLVISLGADGQPGGDGDAADVTSAQRDADD
jgi:general secretion pathway protein G